LVHHKLGCRGPSTGIGLKPGALPLDGALTLGLIFREDKGNPYNSLDFSAQKVIIDIGSQ
jgi:hypothetical protein